MSRVLEPAGEWKARADIAEARVIKLEAALEDFVIFGTRHDTNPTRLIFRTAEVDASEAWWLAYFQSADQGVRDRARTALTGES